MLSGRRILAVVPARGGSKGVKLKNIYPVLGRPLLAYVGDIVRGAGFFDRAVVSTDHEGIAEVATASGLNVPFFRPTSLSGDFVGDLDVLLHALGEMERVDAVPYDVVVMLQPTCPLRTVEHVRHTVTRLIEGGWDAVWTISPADVKYHPLKALALTDAGRVDYFDPRGRGIIARQQLRPVYYRNGACYAFTRRCILEERTIMPERAGAVVIEEPLISIDTFDDFERVGRVLLSRQREPLQVQ